MRIVSVIILSILCFAKSQAQDNFFHNTEVELWDGICIPIGEYCGGKTKVGMSLGANFRYNFRDKPWDCGVFIQLDQARRTINETKHNNKTASFGLSGSYNFNQGKRFNPYLSIGVGTGYNLATSDDSPDISRWSAVFIPKIGIEMWQIIRINSYVQLSRKGFNTFGVSLGLTFGKT